MAEEYEYNLANLIRDVRSHLGVPDLPVSIGVSGMDGRGPTPARRDLVIASQFAVATNYTEFAGTAATVETRDFKRPALPASPGDEGYHWNNNCESLWLVGQAMAEAMINMIENMDRS